MADRLASLGCDAELYIASGESEHISVSGEELEQVESAAEEGMGLRLFAGGRMGFAYTNTADPAALSLLTERARAMLAIAAPDQHRLLPLMASAPHDPAMLDLVDASLMRTAALDWLERVRAGARAARAEEARVTAILRAGFSKAHSRTWILNSRGESLTEESTACGYGISCVAEADGQTQVGSLSQSSRHAGELVIDRVSREAARRTTALLGARALSSGRRTIVLDPWVGVEFLGLIAAAINGDTILKRKSFLADRLGSRVAAPLVSVIDDATLPRGTASAAFDDEGAATRRIAVLTDGVFTAALHDSYTAARTGTASTGSAGRASFRSAPAPGSSNFFIAPGRTPPAALIGDIIDGIYVLEVIGMHTADSVTGEFSLGIAGRVIEHGRLARAVNGMTIAGSLPALLEAISGVGDDLVFYDGHGAPTLRVEGVMVGGVS